ncbi:tetratricopeptide repeat protein [Mucilaginibacter sp.]|uniref:tetratricopeptide repeat protein n=1 Tax=Mucilaginibacter sp. TaxID=1882438 RepID=UPI003D1145CA
MKRTVYFFLMFVLPSLCFGNNPADGFFASGNTFYAKGNYKEALAAYQKVLDAGYQSAALYFNMGNASYKTDDIASAILYYEKAHKLNPADEDINFNIRYANLKTTDKIDEAPEFFITRWWRGFILGFSLNTLALLSILFILAASGVLILYFFANAVLLKKVSFFSSIALFFVGAIFVFIGNRQTNYTSAHKEAIVFSSSTNVKSSPVDKAATLFVIHDGTKVNILDSSNGWAKIKLLNSNEGWIRSADIKAI